MEPSTRGVSGGLGTSLAPFSNNDQQSRSDSGGLGTSLSHNSCCIVPFGLVKLRLTEEVMRDYRRYLNHLTKQLNCRQRIRFLTSCLKNDLIPKFLNFRVPNNGCFEATTVHNFQRRLLRKEISTARTQLDTLVEQTPQLRDKVKLAPRHLLPSLITHTRMQMKQTLRETTGRHNQSRNS